MLSFRVTILLAALPGVPELCFRQVLVAGPGTCPCFRQKECLQGLLGAFECMGEPQHLEYLSVVVPSYNMTGK